MSKLYKVEITAEQMRQLGLKIDPFKRVEHSEYFYEIDTTGQVGEAIETYHNVDTTLYNIANYCTDKGIMEQRALHETLDRLLWWFSMQNYGGEIEWGIDWEMNSFNYCIYYDHRTDDWGIYEWFNTQSVGVTYFTSKELAEQAIEEIVKPFIAEHPEFEVGGCCL